MSACDTAWVAVSASLDGAADPAEERLAREHLAGCEACRRLVETARLNRELLESSPVPPPRDGFAADTAELVLRRRRVRQPRPLLLAGLLLLPVGLASAASVEALLWFYETYHPVLSASGWQTLSRWSALPLPPAPVSGWLACVLLAGLAVWLKGWPRLLAAGPLSALALVCAGEPGPALAWAAGTGTVALLGWLLTGLRQGRALVPAALAFAGVMAGWAGLEAAFRHREMVTGLGRELFWTATSLLPAADLLAWVALASATLLLLAGTWLWRPRWAVLPALLLAGLCLPPLGLLREAAQARATVRQVAEAFSPDAVERTAVIFATDSEGTRTMPYPAFPQLAKLAASPELERLLSGPVFSRGWAHRVLQAAAVNRWDSGGVMAGWTSYARGGPPAVPGLLHYLADLMPVRTVAGYGLPGQRVPLSSAVELVSAPFRPWLAELASGSQLVIRPMKGAGALTIEQVKAVEGVPLTGRLVIDNRPVAGLPLRLLPAPRETSATEDERLRYSGSLEWQFERELEGARAALAGDRPLEPFGLRTHGRLWMLTTTTDEEGRFEFPAVPKGDYLLATLVGGRVRAHTYPVPGTIRVGSEPVAVAPIQMSVYEAPDRPANLSFEEGRTGWRGDTVVITSERPTHGQACARLDWGTINGQRPTFVALVQQTRAEGMQGRRFRYSAMVRTDGRTPGALWFRVDRPSATGFFDNMQDRMVNHEDWRRVTIEGVIDADAEFVAFGALHEGPGRLWIDDVRLELLDE